MNSPRRHRRGDSRSSNRRTRVKFSPQRLRIVSGSFRGRKINYHGDPATRPMKERTRESVFSLLGGDLSGMLAVDLFAGTGILAFESISRGAEVAILYELSRLSVKTILENMATLGVQGQITVHHADTLRLLRQPSESTLDWPQIPWVVFCCPPYAMWKREKNTLVAGLVDLFHCSPSGSRFVCETDQNFDLPNFIPQLEWRIREYDPAIICIAEKRSDD